MGRTAKTATTTSLPLPLQFLAAWIATWLGEHQARMIEYQRAENAALLERLGKHRLRLTDGERRRLAKLGKALGRKALQQVATIAAPDTILRWYRELVAAKYDGSKKRGPGRPTKAAGLERLLLEMATRNTTWGYTRLRDAMNNVGYDIGRTTIQRILAEHGIAPAPQRKREYSWATFIKAHLGAIAGMDFFTVEVLTVMGLVRYHVLFVIDIGAGLSRWWVGARSGRCVDEANGADPARRRGRILARKAHLI